MGKIGENRIIERKLRSTKVRLFTVPCCSIILFSSEGMKKTYLNLLIKSSFYRLYMYKYAGNIKSVPEIIERGNLIIERGNLIIERIPVL